MLQSIIERGQKIVGLVFLFFGCLFHFMCNVKDKRLIVIGWFPTLSNKLDKPHQIQWKL